MSNEKKSVVVPLDIPEEEVAKIMEDHKKFNEKLSEETKISYDEYLNKALETSLLEYELRTKCNFKQLLESDIEELKGKIKLQYMLGIKGNQALFDAMGNSVNEIDLTKKETITTDTNHFKNEYIRLLADVILIIDMYDIDDAKEYLDLEILANHKRNKAELLKSIDLAKEILIEQDAIDLTEKLVLLSNFKEYVKVSI